MDKELLHSFMAWLGPILSALITSGGLAIINAKLASSEKKRDEARAETEAKRKAEAEWRERIEYRVGEIDAKVCAINDATQTTMRATLLHQIEKYLTRGWITPEERASIYDMHAKYSSLNANGLIDGYMERVSQLPDKEI